MSFPKGNLLLIILGNHMRITLKLISILPLLLSLYCGIVYQGAKSFKQTGGAKVTRITKHDFSPLFDYKSHNYIIAEVNKNKSFLRYAFLNESLYSDEEATKIKTNLPMGGIADIHLPEFNNDFYGWDSTIIDSIKIINLKDTTLLKHQIRMEIKENSLYKRFRHYYIFIEDFSQEFLLTIHCRVKFENIYNHYSINTWHVVLDNKEK